MSGKVEQGFVFELGPAALAGGAQPQQAIKALREEVVAAFVQHRVFVGEREAVLPPRPVEVRQRPVVEHIEEVAQREIFAADPLDEQGRVVLGQDALRPGEAVEGDGHLQKKLCEMQLRMAADGTRSGGKGGR